MMSQALDKKHHDAYFQPAFQMARSLDVGSFLIRLAVYMSCFDAMPRHRRHDSLGHASVHILNQPSNSAVSVLNKVSSQATVCQWDLPFKSVCLQWSSCIFGNHVGNERRETLNNRSSRPALPCTLSIRFNVL